MNKICQKCKCENDERYAFCKNCGTLLEDVKTEKNNVYENFEFSYQQATTDNVQHDLETIEGVHISSIYTFVGKNSEKIITKFRKLETSGNKVAWCWPAAILGALWGFFGAALWLLYRKMYKPALVAIAISLAITVVTMISTYDTTYRMGVGFSNYLGEVVYAQDTDDIVEAAEAFSEEMMEIIQTQEYNFGARIVNFLNNTDSIVAALFFGLFGFLLYKRHTIKKIKEYDAKNGMSEYYTLGLKTLGDTSGLALALGIVAAVVIPTIIELIPFINAFM